MHDMTPVFELAGFCAVEALLNLSEDESKLAPGEAGLVPSVIVQNPDGKRAFTICDTPSPETFEQIEGLLSKLTPSDLFAVVTSDAYVTIDEKKRDAIRVEGHLLVLPRKSFGMVIPYEHADVDRPFRFSEPLITGHDGFDITEIDVNAAFVRGRDSHSDAARIWQTYYDPAT